MVTRLGPWAHDRRKLVVALWLVLLVARVPSRAPSEAASATSSTPDVESKAGFDILDAEFGGQGTGQVGTIVFRAERGVDDPAVRMRPRVDGDRALRSASGARPRCTCQPRFWRTSIPLILLAT